MNFDMDVWFKDLIFEVKKYFPQLNDGLVLDAYKFSEELYESRLKEEEDNQFILRPRDIVDHLRVFKPDEDTILAALLFDAIDSGKMSLEAIAEHFGDDTRVLVDGIQVLKSIKIVRYQSVDKLDLLRKLFFVMARDIRVLVVFLSAKIVQMKLLEKLPLDCAEGFSKDVVEVFVPIASRLGIYRYKTILEDAAFKILHPEDYKYIDDYLVGLGETKKEYIDEVCDTLKEFYQSHGFKEVSISGRLKGHYSIFNKMRKKNLIGVEGVYDIFAVRAVFPTDDVSVLYAALGMLHSKWRPIPSRFKDYIAVPKPNGYQSLHTTVMGLTGTKIMDSVHPVEVQIRSLSMHEEAEYGVASHWMYKDAGGRALSVLKNHVEWLSNIAMLHMDSQGDEGILESMKLDFFGDRIYVLTPKGDVKDLPKGATPLDFAYTVHTDIGHRCILARVNGKAVPLDAELENGDTVEIVTQKGSRPKLEWLAIAKTNQAKIKIKSYFASQDKEKNLKAGREQINTCLRRYGKSILTPSLSLLKNYAGQNLSMEEREKLVEEVGKGTQSASNVVKKIFTHDELLDLGRLKVLETRDKKIDTVASAPLVSPKHIIVGGLEGVEVSIAKCCAPTYGDDIVAYVSTIKSSAKIHKKDCSLIKKLDQNRVVKARFKGQDYSVSDLPGGVVGYGGMKPSVYRVKVKIEATSRIGLLGDLGSTIASNGVNIYSYSALPVDAKKDVYYIIMDLDVTGVDQFEKVLNSIEKVDGVSKVVKF